MPVWHRCSSQVFGHEPSWLVCAQVQLLSKTNTGTFAAQWMVSDYNLCGLRNAQLWNPDLCLEVQNRSFHIKDNQCLPPNDSLTLRFESGKPVPDSTFWVVEMIPGVSEMRVTRPSKGV